MMPIEHARPHSVSKVWGLVDLRPWSDAHGEEGPIGEIWYERPGNSAPSSVLLLKLLFTNQPLSIQVHPDDTCAHAMGLPSGKSEAWYVLSATPDAKVALGLKERTSPQQFRAAVDSGSILDLVAWQAVSPDDVVFVPGGTIHAIGAGVVIAEIQQRSDATFRVFDYDRKRELHIESAITAADAGPAALQVQPNCLTNERTLLVASQHFVFEKVDLPPASTWRLDAERETWFLILKGNARAGSFDVGIGEAIFAQSDRVDIQTGQTGIVGLVAYAGGDLAQHLLQRIKQPGAMNVGPSQGGHAPRLIEASSSPTNSPVESIR